MVVAQLTEAERAEALAALPEWTLRADGLAIERNFKFKTFSEAWAFMARVALIAERREGLRDRRAHEVRALALQARAQELAVAGAAEPREVRGGLGARDAAG